MAASLRVGDAEREATAASLREHYAHGRLTTEEFQQRLDATFAAKTDLDLASVTSDLPHAPTLGGPWPPPAPLASSRSRSNSGTGSDRTTAPGARRPRPRARAWAIVNVALFLIAMFLIVALFRPLGWLEALVPKPVLILVSILIFLRQALRRTIRGGRPRGRGRRF